MRIKPYRMRAMRALCEQQLFEIEAMLRTSGLTARALALRAKLNENTLKKAIHRLKEGGRCFEGTMEKLRAAMRGMGYADWMGGTDQDRLRAAIASASRLLGPITPRNADEAAAFVKQILDTLLAQPRLTDNEIQVAADNLADGLRRRSNE